MWCSASNSGNRPGIIQTLTRIGAFVDVLHFQIEHIPEYSHCIYPYRIIQYSPTFAWMVLCVCLGKISVCCGLSMQGTRCNNNCTVVIIMMFPKYFFYSLSLSPVYLHCKCKCLYCGSAFLLVEPLEWFRCLSITRLKIIWYFSKQRAPYTCNIKASEGVINVQRTIFAMRAHSKYSNVVINAMAIKCCLKPSVINHSPFTVHGTMWCMPSMVRWWTSVLRSQIMNKKWRSRCITNNIYNHNDCKSL